MSTLVENQTIKLNTTAHLMAAWPLMIAILGGAVGIILGIIAYLINLKVYSSPLSRLNKVLANLLCGMSVISLWWFIAQWLQATV